MNFIHFENSIPQARINLENMFGYGPVISNEKFKRKMGINEILTREDISLKIYSTNLNSKLILQFPSRKELEHAVWVLDRFTNITSFVKNQHMRGD